MKFGVFDHLDRNDLALSDYYEMRLRIAEAYDAAGFYAYHVAEHHSTPLGMAPSPSVFLAAVAQRTQNLRFGPLVYALPLYHPLRMIEEICMLDQMSRGRLEIGFGRGSTPAELRYYGQDPDNAQKIYSEYLSIVIKGLTEPVLNFNGAYFHLDNVPQELGPFQKPHPPIWYGVHAPDSAARAGRMGLRVVSLDPPAQTSDSFDCFRATWREAHGAAPLPLMGIGRFIVVDENGPAALETARRAYLKWHDSFTFLHRLHKRVNAHPRPPDFDALMADGQGIAGAPDAVAAFLQSQIDLTGANYIVGQFVFGDMRLEESLSSIDAFKQRVIPRLRDASV